MYIKPDKTATQDVVGVGQCFLFDSFFSFLGVFLEDFLVSLRDIIVLKNKVN